MKLKLQEITEALPEELRPRFKHEIQDHIDFDSKNGEFLVEKPDIVKNTHRIAKIILKDSGLIKQSQRWYTR